MIKRSQTSNDGRAFEELVFNVYSAVSGGIQGAIVTKNEMIEGPDGVRKVDILVRHQILESKYTTVIECKDYSRPINVTTLDAFNDKIRDLKANKGILVSRGGFSGRARKKAERVGIDLCIADTAGSIVVNLAQNIPIVVNKISVVSLGIGGSYFRLPEIVGRLDFKDGTLFGMQPLEMLLNGLERNLVFEMKDHALYSAWNTHLNRYVCLKDFFGEDYLNIELGSEVNIELQNAIVAFQVKEDL